MATDLKAWEERREILSRRHGAALVELAMLASPAVRVESALLGTLRRRFAPHLPSDVEGALWFSDLVRVQGIDGMVLRNEVRLVLLKALQGDGRAEAVWELVAAFHQRLSPALRVEEAVGWLGARLEVRGDRSGDPQDVALRSSLSRELMPLLKAALEPGRRRGLARWLGRALTGLPETVRRQDEVRGLHTLLKAEGHALPALRVPPPDAGFFERYAWLLDPLPKLKLAVVATGSELQLGPLREFGGVFQAEVVLIEVPATEPIELVLEWLGLNEEVQESVSVTGSEVVHVRARSPRVRVFAADGAVYELDLSREQDELPPDDFLGAWPTAFGTHFRTWLPGAEEVLVAGWKPRREGAQEAFLEKHEVMSEAAVAPGEAPGLGEPDVIQPLEREREGCWRGFAEGIRAGDRYEFRIRPARFGAHWTTNA